VIETGAVDKFGFDETDLALMCASHSSEDFHIARAKNMLSRIKAEEDDLRCGGHPAVSEEVNREWIKTGFEPTGICNNCSGKHVAMMAGAEALGADVKDYHLPDHPMQLEVKRVVDDLAHDPKQVEWGVDGCNLPAPAYPLFYLAQKYATFADAADAVEASSPTSQRTQNFARIFNAMTKHPEQVGGTGRLLMRLME
jgi:L-asparaginase II